MIWSQLLQTVRQRGETISPLSRAFTSTAVTLAAAAAGGVCIGAAFPRFGPVWSLPAGLVLAGIACLRARGLGRTCLAGVLITVAWLGMATAWMRFGTELLIGKADEWSFLWWAILEVPPTVIALAAAFLITRARDELWPLAAALFIAVAEYVRTNGQLGIPYGQIAEPFAGTPLRAVFPVVGGPGFAFTITLLAFSVAYAVTRRRLAPLLYASATCALVGAVSALSWAARAGEQPFAEVAVVQSGLPTKPHYGAAELRGREELYLGLARRAALRYRPALIALPEDAIHAPLSDDVATQLRIADLAKSAKTVISVGVQERGDDGREYNELWNYDADSGIPVIYRKRRLVPFGEYVPLPNLLRKVFDLANVPEISPGAELAEFRVRGLTVAPLICWESSFEDLSRLGPSDPVDAFVMPSDDGWYVDSAGGDSNLHLAQLRSLENGVYAIRSTPTGLSAVINPKGELTAMATYREKTTLSGRIGRHVTTPYRVLGPVLVLCLLTALAAVSHALLGGLTLRRPA